jgi:hypothetical protein
MQKKKPSFQVIPNYGFNGVQAGMSPEKCLRNMGARILAAQPLRPRQLSAGLIAVAELSRQSARLGPNCIILTRKWCDAIAVDRRLRQPCSLNIQAKYETLAVDRSDSLL